MLTATPSLPLWTSRETIVVDTNPSSKMSVIMEIVFMKRVRAVGPGGLSRHFLRDRKKLGLKTIETNLDKKIDPKDWKG